MKRHLLAVAALSAVFTGCTAPEQIGATDSNAALRGSDEFEALGPGLPDVRRVYLRGDSLKKGQAYTFNHIALAIIGDIPDGVSIRGYSGQLNIGGDVGRNVTLEVANERGRMPYSLASSLIVFGEVGEKSELKAPGGRIVITPRN